MENNTDLSKLEKVVEKMFEKFGQLKKEKAELESAVAEKNQQIEELNTKVDSLSSNQEEISSRVTSLISSIEDWEGDGDSASTEDKTAADSGSTGSDEPAKPVEAQLF